MANKDKEYGSLESDVPSTESDTVRKNENDKRRDVVKAIVSGSVLTAGTATSSHWVKPAIDAVVLPSHAQTSEPDVPPTPDPDPLTRETYSIDSCELCGSSGNFWAQGGVSVVGAISPNDAGIDLVVNLRVDRTFVRIVNNATSSTIEQVLLDETLATTTGTGGSFTAGSYDFWPAANQDYEDPEVGPVPIAGWFGGTLAGTFPIVRLDQFVYTVTASIAFADSPGMVEATCVNLPNTISSAACAI